MDFARNPSANAAASSRHDYRSISDGDTGARTRQTVKERDRGILANSSTAHASTADTPKELTDVASSPTAMQRQQGDVVDFARNPSANAAASSRHDYRSISDGDTGARTSKTVKERDRGILANSTTAHASTADTPK